MKDVFLSNTLTKNIEKLVPINKNEVKMYCCGPTVYNYAHIGNLRTYIFEDILAKTLKLAGYKINHVMNITDVGHLVGDGDDGEDKMLVAAEKEQQNVFEIARKYEKIFFKHTESLGINRPNIVCRATEHVEEMINFIKALEEKGYAYFSNGRVYFDTSKFANYGSLSGQNRDDLMHGARVEEDLDKKNPSDFILWFTSSKFENHILQWDSPWGRGYPGWHIECSAMAMKYLGEEIDIHCGGMDHIPVHHENELAQSEAFSDKKWVNIWLHAEFLQNKTGKMSKSSGEFLTLDTLTSKGYKPEHFKYSCLLVHYKKPLIFSYESLDAAANAYNKLTEKIKKWKTTDQTVDSIHEQKNINKLELYKNNFEKHLYNDLSTPQALSVLWDLSKDDSLPDSYKLEFAHYIDSIFGLSLDSNSQIESIAFPKEIEEIAEKRKGARNDKNWELSDKLRDKLNSLGYEIKDLTNNEYKLSSLKQK